MKFRTVKRTSYFSFCVEPVSISRVCFESLEWRPELQNCVQFVNEIPKELTSVNIENTRPMMLPIWSKCISGSCPNHSWRSDFRPLLRGYHSFKISFKKPQKSSKNRIYTRKSTIFIDVPPQYRLRALQSAVLLLPDENREVLQTLLLFLSDISECKDVNQMPASNLAVCFAPSLFQIAMNNPKFKLRSRVY